MREAEVITCELTIRRRDNIFATGLDEAGFPLLTYPWNSTDVVVFKVFGLASCYPAWP